MLALITIEVKTQTSVDAVDAEFCVYTESVNVVFTLAPNTPYQRLSGSK